MKTQGLQWLLILALGASVATGCAQRPRGIETRADEPRRVGGTSVDYTVAPGDSWATIAESFFGEAGNADRIARDNGSNPASAPTVGKKISIRVEEKEVDRVRRIGEARGPYNAGVEALARDDAAAARQAFERALERAPHFVDARYNLGLALIREGQHRAARRELQKVARERPDDKDVHYALAASHFHDENYSGAVAPLERALVLDPAFLRARYTLALSYEKMGESAKARRAWREYLERDSSSQWAEEARQHLRDLGAGS